MYHIVPNFHILGKINKNAAVLRSGAVMVFKDGLPKPTSQLSSSGLHRNDTEKSLPLGEQTTVFQADVFSKLQVLRTELLENGSEQEIRI